MIEFIENISLRFLCATICFVWVDTRNMYTNLNIMSGSINQYLSPKLNSGDYVTRNVHNWVHQLILHERKYVMQKKKMSPYLPQNAQQTVHFSLPFHKILPACCVMWIALRWLKLFMNHLCR